ncbi:AI-2E family transporter [Tabrizicola sp. J26]|uniref:AI-2E family transporter n=1 Tax=Alitabrizicola rongguiensis TaxID=2909234 RepID=UPI001F470F6C|nr:AI-2E family transporter [Tabrizicola rongguiensis]MCF1708149.1 AI-2E family transporter [Tabrizicola rongguiensis]
MVQIPSQSIDAIPAWSGDFRRITLTQLAAITGVAAVLHVAHEVFLPLAIAMLIAFALSPAVAYLRRAGMPQLLTVIAVVVAAFVVISLFLLVVVGQLGELAANLPTFQANIITKVDAIRDAGSGSGVVSRLTDMLSAINQEIGAAVPSATEPSAPLTHPRQPLPVEIIESQHPLELLSSLVLPLISPIATIGLVFVLVIFMLLEQDELRDRFIRLVGSNDLHRTTELLEEAGGRVANYLVMQLLVNTIYALPIGIGLWVIGVPNALLWGMLTLVLRFVPYIGSVLAAVFPLFLAFAVSPGWEAVLWTAALFAVVELVTSNVIEPWLYGSRTGVSPLAIIIAAIFWTFIWGTPGLVLSTPLTVCLVVLGRHIPQFELFGILFGDDPVLEPKARLYQRLLAGDAVEATSRAEEELEQMPLADFYEKVGLPALQLGQLDLDRGLLTAEQQDRLAGAAMAMIEDLEVVATEEFAARERSDSAGVTVICIGGRSRLDEVSAAILAQTLRSYGIDGRVQSRLGLTTGRSRPSDFAGMQCVMLCFLDPNPSRVSLIHLRRLRAAAPDLRIGVVLWQFEHGAGPQSAPEKEREAKQLGADFVVTDRAGIVAQFVPDDAESA